METERRVAGRELDRIVAVLVEGWQQRTIELNPEQLLVAPPDWTRWSRVYWWGRTTDHLVPPYSTDIVAAWPLAARLKLAVIPLEGGGFLAGRFCDDWGGGYIDGEGGVVDARMEHYATADTAALAICCAALVTAVSTAGKTPDSPGINRG